MASPSPLRPLHAALRLLHSAIKNSALNQSAIECLEQSGRGRPRSQEKSAFRNPQSAIFLFLFILLAFSAPAAPPRLEWDPRLGAALRTDNARITLDRNERAPAILLRYWPGGARQSLTGGEATIIEPQRLRLVYRSEGPRQEPLQVVRDIAAREDGPSVTVLTEQFTLSATLPLRAADLEVERPFMIESDAPATSSSELSLILPHVSGWAEVTTVGQAARGGEYRFSGGYPRAAGAVDQHPLTDDATSTAALSADEPVLALPMVQVGGPGWRCAVMADPAGGAHFAVRALGGGVSGAVSYYSAARTVALTSLSRTFAWRLQTGNVARRPFDGALEAYAPLIGAAPPPPDWPRQVALVHVVDFDALTTAPEAGLARLAGWLDPAERARVAVVFRHWGGAIFPYGFDQSRGAFDRAWLIPGAARPRWMTPAALRQTLHAARALGFRVLLAMGEGLAADSATPFFPADWALRGSKGELLRTPRAGLQPYGPLALLNPADPRVAQWMRDYADALLAEFGKELDGLIYGGAWRIPSGAAVAQPRPAWADAAQLALVRDLRARVKAFSPELILLTTDNPGHGRAPYALAADGALNESEFSPDAAARGLIPCAHGVLWDSSRAAAQRFPSAVWCARALGLPLMVGGAGLDPAAWTKYQRDRVLKAFGELRERSGAEDRALYLQHDPAEALKCAPDHADAGDTVPQPAPGELNWAADARTSVSASSQVPLHPAVAAIRPAGVVGWCSDSSHTLPEWLALDFGAPRPLNRFVIHNFQNSLSTTATAGNLGLTRYSIQGWDEEKEAWNSVIVIDQPQAVRTRVHALKSPLTTRRVRLLVSDVASLDGVARVAGFEAWGPGGDAKVDEGKMEEGKVNEGKMASPAPTPAMAPQAAPPLQPVAPLFEAHATTHTQPVMPALKAPDVGTTVPSRMAPPTPPAASKPKASGEGSAPSSRKTKSSGKSAPKRRPSATPKPTPKPAAESSRGAIPD